nr:hypothetical protein [Candidatus Freyarchaeota archaeon]
MGRGALLTGMAGGIIGTIASVVGIIWSISSMVAAVEFHFFFFTLSPLLIFSTILFVALLIVSCILTGVGFYGMYTVGGGGMGVVGLIFGIIGGIIAAILILIGLITYPSGTIIADSYYSWSILWNWIGFIILGISFIIMGSASIAVRECTPHSGTAVAAGVLSIIGGSTFIIYMIFFAWIGLILIFVAFLLWAIVFYTTEA